MLGGRGGQGAGGLYRLKWANLCDGSHTFLVIRACVRTEEATATFGYKAYSAAVGPGHIFPNKCIDGYTATGAAPETFVSEHLPHVSIGLIGTLHVLLLYIKFCVYPDEKFAPNDIYLL
jgi:hypothetical protein